MESEQRGVLEGDDDKLCVMEEWRDCRESFEHELMDFCDFQ